MSPQSGVVSAVSGQRLPDLIAAPAAAEFSQATPPVVMEDRPQLGGSAGCKLRNRPSQPLIRGNPP